MRRLRFWAAGTAFALTACVPWGYADLDFVLPAKRKAEVADAAESFAVNLRWGRYQAAAARVIPDKRIEFLKLVQDPKAPIRFTGWEVMTVVLGEEMSEATALVALSFHRLPSMTEVQLLDEQTWRFDPKRAAWYLVPKLDTYRNAGKPKYGGS